MGDTTSQRLFVDFASLKHSENQCFCMGPSMGPSNYGHLRCLFSGLSVTMTKSRLSPFQGFALFMRSSLHGGSLPSTGDESYACNSETKKSLLFVSSLCSGIGGSLLHAGRSVGRSVCLSVCLSGVLARAFARAHVSVYVSSRISLQRP